MLNDSLRVKLIKISLLFVAALMLIFVIMFVGARASSPTQSEAASIAQNYIDTILAGEIRIENTSVANFKPVRAELSQEADRIGIGTDNSVRAEYLLYNDVLLQPLVATVLVSPNFPNTFADWTASISKVRSNIGGLYDLVNTNCSAPEIDESVSEEEINLNKTDYIVCLKVSEALSN